MKTDLCAPQTSDAIAAELLLLSPEYAPTPLIDMPTLARRLGVAQALVKDEGCRMLRSFKSLGGTYAGLRALARAAGLDIAGLIEQRPTGLPTLVCASDGNHGLAVAAAARFAGGPARIFLHSGVSAARAARIEAMGAEIVWIDGTYDDTVDAAAEAVRGTRDILVADTTELPSDPVVADVMAGYGVIAAEIRQQVQASGLPRPTHVFVQAGVGGLAAAVADGLKGWMAPPAAVIVVEPAEAACVEAALAAGAPVRLAGALETTAGMLSCGEASTPALAVLRRCGAGVVTVSEAALEAAPVELRALGGPSTTPSGGASLAGALAAADDAGIRARFGIGAESRVLILVTEAAIEEDGDRI